jgi:hypothetical protein
VVRYSLTRPESIPTLHTILHITGLMSHVNPDCHSDCDFDFVPRSDTSSSQSQRQEQHHVGDSMMARR